MNSKRQHELDALRNKSLQEWHKARLNEKVYTKEADRGPISAAAGASGTGSGGIVPTGAWFYAVTYKSLETSKLYAVNAETGQYILIGDTGVDHFSGIALDKSGTLWGVSNKGSGGSNSNKKTWTIDKETAAATLIGVNSNQIPDITVDGNNIIRGWTESSDDPIIINRTTGEVVVTAQSDLNTGGTGVATADENGYIMVKDYNDLYKVNCATGAYSFIGVWPVTFQLNYGYESLNNSFDNWENDYIGVARDSGGGDSTSTRLYKLKNEFPYVTGGDDNFEYLSTVPFGISGIAKMTTSPIVTTGTPVDAWSPITGGLAGNGTIVETSPGIFSIVGSSDGVSNGWTLITKDFSESTALQVKYNYTTNDGILGTDRPIRFMSASVPTVPETDLTFAKYQPEKGCFTVNVPGGRYYTMGVYSTDSAEGPGYLDLEITGTPLEPVQSSGSISFNGANPNTTGSYVSISRNEIAEWVPGTGSWTIEWFQKMATTGSGGAPRVWSMGPDTGAKIGVSIEGDRVYVWPFGAYAPITGLYKNVWVHFALVYDSTATAGTLSIYQNGTRIGTPATGLELSIFQDAPQRDLYLGSDGITANDGYAGKITNFRWTNSVVYTGASFTPVTSPLALLPETYVLLNGGTSANPTVDSSYQNHATYKNITWDIDSPFA